jgi:hypothetical protein
VNFTVPVNATRAYRRVEVQLQLFLTYGLDGKNSQLHASAALSPGKEPTVPIEYEEGCAPEAVLAFRRRQIPFPAGNRNTVPQTSNLA